MDQLEAQWLANVHQLLDGILTDAEEDASLLRSARGAVTRRRALEQMLAALHRTESRIVAEEMPRRAGRFHDRYTALISPPVERA